MGNRGEAERGGGREERMQRGREGGEEKSWQYVEVSDFPKPYSFVSESSWCYWSQDHLKNWRHHDMLN